MRSSGTACARSPTRTPGELRLESRNLNDITDTYPELARLNRALELAQRDPRRRDRRLRRRRAAELRGAAAAHARRLQGTGANGWPKSTPVTYMIFDLLWLDGHSLMELPYSRAPRAAAARSSSTASSWQTPEHVARRRRGAAARRAPSRASRASSPSAWTRPISRACARGDWVKIKNVRAPGVRGRRLDAGQGQAQRAHRRAAARACTSRRRAALRRARRQRLQRAASSTGCRGLLGAAASDPARRSRPAGAPPRGRRLLRAAAGRRGRVQRVDRRGQPAPALLQGPARGQGRRRRSCARIRAERGSASSASDDAAPIGAGDGCAAAPRRPPSTVGGRELKLSNLDKVLYPQAGFTKRDLIDYYAAIAPVLLAAPARPSADRQALARRRRGQVVLPEAGAGAPAGLGAAR